MAAVRNNPTARSTLTRTDSPIRKVDFGALTCRSSLKVNWHPAVQADRLNARAPMLRFMRLGYQVSKLRPIEARYRFLRMRQEFGLVLGLLRCSPVMRFWFYKIITVPSISPKPD